MVPCRRGILHLRPLERFSKVTVVFALANVLNGKATVGIRLEAGVLDAAVNLLPVDARADPASDGTARV